MKQTWYVIKKYTDSNTYPYNTTEDILIPYYATEKLARKELAKIMANDFANFVNAKTDKSYRYAIVKLETI